MNKFVHAITDGGAKPNPGSAGWGAILRQNGRFACSFGHFNRASNNAMELRAVIRALMNLPSGLHIWVMTDSDGSVIKVYTVAGCNGIVWLSPGCVAPRGVIRRSWWNATLRGTPADVFVLSFLYSFAEEQLLPLCHNNNPSTWSGPRGLVGCTGQARGALGAIAL
jgi:hypothetical protein